MCRRRRADYQHWLQLARPGCSAGAVRKFWDADFYEEVRETRAARLVESSEELTIALSEALGQRELRRESRQQLLERQLGVAPNEAVDAAIQVILETSKPEICRSSR